MSVMLALGDEAKEGANGWVNRVVELWLIHEPWDKPEDMQWYGKDSGPREKTPGLMRTEAFEAAVQAIDVDDDYIHSINASDAPACSTWLTKRCPLVFSPFIARKISPFSTRRESMVRPLNSGNE